MRLLSGSQCATSSVAALTPAWDFFIMELEKKASAGKADHRVPDLICLLFDLFFSDFGLNLALYLARTELC